MLYRKPKAFEGAYEMINLDQEDITYLLDLIHDNPDYFLDELLHLLETNCFISVHYTTIFRELKHLNVSCKILKKLKKIAIERDEARRADFIARMAQYSPEELGFIDEMSKDGRSIGRRYGRSRKNTRAQKEQVFVILSNPKLYHDFQKTVDPTSRPLRPCSLPVEIKSARSQDKR